MKGSHWKWETFWVESTLISLCGAFCHHRDEKRSSKLHFPLVRCYRGAGAAGSSCAGKAGRTEEDWLGLQGLTLCRARALIGLSSPSGSAFLLSLLFCFNFLYFRLGFIWACEGKEWRCPSFCLDKSITKQLSAQRGLLGLHQSCSERTVNRRIVLEVFMQRAG